MGPGLPLIMGIILGHKQQELSQRDRSTEDVTEDVTLFEMGFTVVTRHLQRQANVTGACCEHVIYEEHVSARRL